MWWLSLNVRVVSSAAVAMAAFPPPSLAEQLEVFPAPGLGETDEQGVEDGFHTVRGVLEALELSEFISAFEENGIVNVDMLTSLSQHDMELVMNDVWMVRSVDRFKVRRWWRGQQQELHADTGYADAWSSYPSWNTYASTPTPLQQENNGCCWNWIHYHQQMPQPPPPNAHWWPPPHDPRAGMNIAAMACDPHHVRAVQEMIIGIDADPEHRRYVMREVVADLTNIMFNMHGLFVVRACYQYLVSVDMDAVDPIHVRECLDFAIASLTAVKANWNQLVSGRSSATTYKMLLWMFEFLYMKGHLEFSDLRLDLEWFCDKTLNSASHLVRSNFGHHVLQHAVLLTQKALVRATAPQEIMTWTRLRHGFFHEALLALLDKAAWDKKGNSASHFINKVLNLIESDVHVRDPDILAHKMEILRKLVLDKELIAEIVKHDTGKWTARRVYEVATPEIRRALEAIDNKIHKPELRQLENFKASIIPDNLNWPRI